MESEQGAILVLQFARAPIPGQVKTRMLSRLSPQEACALHCELVLWTTRRLARAQLGELELCVAGALADPLEYPLFAECLAQGALRVSAQCGADLGERMAAALARGLQGFPKVILVGSDCPGIDAAYLWAASRALEHAAVVLGPATDGGYVLMGVREEVAGVLPSLFQGIHWGSDRVYAQTIEKLAAADLQWSALPALADVDRPEDLPVWEAYQQGRMEGTPSTVGRPPAR